MSDFTYNGQNGNTILDFALIFLIYAASLAAFFFVAYILIKAWVKSEKEKNLFLENQEIPRLVQNLRGWEFEIWLKELLASMGVQARVVGGSGDEGLDVIAVKSGKKYGFQCKMYFENKLVSQNQTALAYAAKWHHHLNKIFLVTTGNIHHKARKWAEDKPDLVLIDGALLKKIILDRNILLNMLK